MSSSPSMASEDAVLERPITRLPSQTLRRGLPTGDRPTSIIAGEGFLVQSGAPDLADLIAWQNRPTGEETRIHVWPVTTPDLAASVMGLLTSVTGYARNVLPILEVFLSSEDSLLDALTSRRVPIRVSR